MAVSGSGAGPSRWLGSGPQSRVRDGERLSAVPLSCGGLGRRRRRPRVTAALLSSASLVLLQNLGRVSLGLIERGLHAQAP